MILINITTRESYYNCYPTFAAEKIGIDPETARRWRRAGLTYKRYAEWEMYFTPEEVKQCKGFGKR